MTLLPCNITMIALLLVPILATNILAQEEGIMMETPGDSMVDETGIGKWTLALTLVLLLFVPMFMRAFPERPELYKVSQSLNFPVLIFRIG